MSNIAPQAQRLLSTIYMFVSYNLNFNYAHATAFIFDSPVWFTSDSTLAHMYIDNQTQYGLMTPYIYIYIAIRPY